LLIVGGPVRVLFAVMLLVGVLLRPMTAAGFCSAGPLVVSPIDGEEDVPLDTWIVVHTPYDDFAPVPEDPVLIEVDTGREIPLAEEELADTSGVTVLLRPTELLRPYTRYEVPDHYTRPPRFITGSSLTAPPQSFDGLLAARALVSFEVDQANFDDNIFRPDDGRARATSLCLTYGAPTGGMVAVQVELRGLEDGSLPWQVLLRPHDEDGLRYWPSRFGQSVCGVMAPPFSPGDTFLASARTLDAKGQLSPPTTPLRVVVEEVDWAELRRCSGVHGILPTPSPRAGPGLEYTSPEATSTSVAGCTCMTSTRPSAGVAFATPIVALLAARLRRRRRASRVVAGGGS
jgi:hypothetical protein